MQDFVYALKERIGHPALFCGRQREMNLLLNWCDLIPKKLAKSRALLGRRKSGKTAIMQRVFNTLWSRNGQVIPFYFEVLDQSKWLLKFADEYFRTFLTQYISFKTRTPLEEEASLYEWNILNDMLTDLKNEKILSMVASFQNYLVKEDEHHTTRLAFHAPATFTSYDHVFFVIMIDEMQYMLKYLFLDKELTNQAQRVPGAFHGLVELKYAPMLVSGSYVGWMHKMMQEIFVGGRLKSTPVSPKLKPAEGMEAVYRYAEHYEIPMTERLALTINHLTQSDPFYIATLFRSDWEQSDFSCEEGIIQTFTHEMLDREGELFKTWAEYIDQTVKKVNDVYGKKMLLYLSREREQESTREEIRQYLGWPEAKDREVEEKLEIFEYGGLIKRGHTDFHYQGIPDDVLDLIFRTRYEYEIERVEPDVAGELTAKIRQLEQEKHSLQGALNELKGRMLELVVWRELNSCRKQGRPLANFGSRMRPVLDKNQATALREMAELCSPSIWHQVWQNYYLQALQQPSSLQADVLAEGEDEQACWALLFEMKNRDEKHPPTMDDVRLFVTKLRIVHTLLRETGKTIRFVCPVYFSAQGFPTKVEVALHREGILTTDLNTWEEHIGS